MWYIVISLIGLGVVAAIAGYFRNKKLQKMLERGEISEIPEAQEIPEVCCGQHETCERDSLLAAVSKKIEYYNDEELDRFQGVEADAYDAEAVEVVPQVLVGVLFEKTADRSRGHAYLFADVFERDLTLVLSIHF